MNSLELNEVRMLRDALIYSLKCWENPEDGFYRSSPTARLSETPSFTNTGVVLQAFNESGERYLAQRLANRLLSYLRDRSYAPFPNEKTGAKEKNHVICNAWITFGILNCYPSAADQMRRICDWFLDSQKGDHSWNLIPGEEMNYPAVTAYALGALLQLHKSYAEIDYDSAYLNRIALAIENATDYLLENRSPFAKDADLYLWPANLDDTGHIASFGTTALCLHVICEASTVLGRNSWETRAGNTLLMLATSFDESTKSNIIQVGRMRVNIWDQIHANESSLNYLWAFFSPVHIATLLKFVENHQFMSNEKYIGFIEYLTRWILDNTSDVGEFTGIRGSQNIPGVKTWSTAQSVIALSRMLNKRELFHVCFPKSSRLLRVFLCHSSNDKPQVRELYSRLSAESIDTWLDEEKILPGQDWKHEITKAVRSADVVIVCLSCGSVGKAGYIQKEIKDALDVADEQPEGTIFLIPLKLEECEVPERLRRWQWVNYFDNNGYLRLMNALRFRARTLEITLPTVT
jgi:hypothetical protein